MTVNESGSGNGSENPTSKPEEVKVYGLFPAKEYKGLKFRIRRAVGESGDAMKIETKISLHDDCVNAVKLLEEKRASMKAEFDASTDPTVRFNLVETARLIDADLADLNAAIGKLSGSVQSKKQEAINGYSW